MSKTIQIDLMKVVKEITGEDLELHSKFAISKGTMCYRFGDDEIHLLTDDCGGYTIIIDPFNEENKKIENGHLGDFTEAIE